MGEVDPRKAAVDAWWMGLERENRQPTANEVHKRWLEAMEAKYLDETQLASDWLLARMPALITPAGFACNFAIHALKGLRRDRPDLTGDALLAAVIAYRDERLRSFGADDLIVPVAGEEAEAA